MQKLEDILFFELDNEYIRINNVLVIVHIAHKIKLEFLWQGFLNYIIPKDFIKSILEQYPNKCDHELFVLISRAVGNLALKRMLTSTTFIKEKSEFLKCQNIKETELHEEACSNQELLEI